ncbi:Fatty acid desaturase 2 [Oryzias melastigma]|uniref:acyl-CoA (8-3)-desaturase n=1 Tax=Oryzias melastigma TaxID=30732 RepID=A0A834FRW3_ORYME|nr:Fatty acid desaturase 2 [Oryzias melastigma]
MGVGGQLTDTVEAGSGRDAGVFTWEEVHKHCSRKDQWLVINRKVYNITQWTKRHPGGSSVISLYAGEDATEAFTAFHPDLNFVQKFLKPLLIGELAAAEPSQDPNKNTAIIQDFEKLRAQAEKDGLFKTKPLFFCLHLGHILLLEVFAWTLLWLWGTGWTATLLSAALLATSQAQAGWLQHDFGHLSVFKKSRWNHLVHKFVIGQLKGASASWWNHLHFRHHSKPNVLDKDPDVNMSGLFVLGAVQPVEYGIKKIKHMPYNHQHQYFFLLAPPLLIPVVFNLQILRTMISRRDWVDLAWYYVILPAVFLLLYPLLWFPWFSGTHHLCQVPGESLVCVGDSDEPFAHGD